MHSVRNRVALETPTFGKKSKCTITVVTASTEDEEETADGQKGEVFYKLGQCSRGAAGYIHKNAQYQMR